MASSSSSTAPDRNFALGFSYCRHERGRSDTQQPVVNYTICALAEHPAAALCWIILHVTTTRWKIWSPTCHFLCDAGNRYDFMVFVNKKVLKGLKKRQRLTWGIVDQDKVNTRNSGSVRNGDHHPSTLYVPFNALMDSILHQRWADSIHRAYGPQMLTLIYHISDDRCVCVGRTNTLLTCRESRNHIKGWGENHAVHSWPEIKTGPLCCISTWFRWSIKGDSLAVPQKHTTKWHLRQQTLG